MSIMANENAVPSVNNGIRKETVKTPVEVTRVYTNSFQKEGTLTAELKQVVNTKSFYPTKKTESSLNGGLFSTEEFGFSETEFDSQNIRMAWILVPAGTTEEETAAKLAVANQAGACIYRVISNAPILDENQMYAIKEKLKTLANFADTQVVRYGAGAKDKTGADVSGKIILDNNGCVQYKKTYFWASPRTDMDIRDKSKEYRSPAIEAELLGASVMEGQSL